MNCVSEYRMGIVRSIISMYQNLHGTLVVMYHRSRPSSSLLAFGAPLPPLTSYSVAEDGGGGHYGLPDPGPEDGAQIGSSSMGAVQGRCDLLSVLSISLQQGEWVLLTVVS